MSEEARPPEGGLARYIFALFAGYSCVATCWAVWGVLTPGDYFANGNPLVAPTLALAGALGIFVGYRTRSRLMRSGILALVVASTLFWACVRDGWWATPPPDSRWRAEGREEAGEPVVPGLERKRWDWGLVLNPSINHRRVQG